MEKLPLTQVTPSYSHSSRSSSRAHDQAFLYDDYAREVPHANAIAARYSIINHEKAKLRLSKRHSPLYIVTLLALVAFVVQLGGSISDVPSTRLLEGLICNEYYRISSGNLLPETHCGVNAVQGELNVITTGTLILDYLPGELQVTCSFRRLLRLTCIRHYSRLSLWLASRQTRAQIPLGSVCPGHGALSIVMDRHRLELASLGSTTCLDFVSGVAPGWRTVCG